MWSDLRPAFRYPLLILGMIALVVGTLAGLGRLGTVVPQIAMNQAALHGVLMIPAFFGTVIGLERAVAIGQRWAYLTPLLTGIGGGALIAGAPPAAGFILISLGSLVFLIASVQVLRIQGVIHNWILFGGAVALFIGNLLLASGYPVGEVIYWWISFLLLTIAGERLELSRLVVQSDQKRMGLALLSIIPLIGAAIELVHTSVGIGVFGLGLAGIGLWLLLFDIARRTVRMDGLTRFTAVCMLAGYFWLLVSALLFIGMESAWGNIGRDPALHTFFLGFVFSMVFGHALIIFPAVTRLNIPYSPIFYLPMLLLQVSLILRVAGSLTGNPELLTYGGIANGVTLAVFILTLVGHIIRGQTTRVRRPAEQATLL